MHGEEQQSRTNHSMRGTYGEGLGGKINQGKNNRRRMQDDADLGKAKLKRRG
jgi:hypothetical protein